MTTNCNIFIVRTPFQLFNAIEAKNRFHAEDENILLIIDNGNKSNMAQIRRVMKCDSSWQETIQLPLFKRRHKLFYQFLYRQTIRQLTNRLVSDVYFAQYRNLTAHIINRIKPESITLFDDGNSIFNTIEFLKKRKSKKYQPLRKVIDFTMCKKTEIDFIYEAKIFTIFDIVGLDLLRNEVVQNKYTYFKGLIGNLERTNDVYFIGSKVVGNGFSKKLFKELMQIVVLHYKDMNKHLIYVPHRYEDVGYIEKLSKEMNFTVSKFTTIIECEFIERKLIPMNLATFRSTAVDTLNLIFNSEVSVFCCNLSQIKNDKQAEFALVYQNFLNKKYRVINVK